MKVTGTVPASSANLGSGVDCMGAALTLYLRVTFTPAEKTSFAFAFADGTVGTLPDADNLILTGMLAAAETEGRPIPPCRVEVQTEIPLARGLGSSSSAIIAGLLGGFTLLGVKPEPQTVLRLAARIEGHPDNVTPAYLGSFTAAAMAGEDVLFQRLSAPPLKAVVAIPAFKLSTEAMRRALPKTVPLADALSALGRAVLLTAALQNGDLEGLNETTRDVLFTPPRKQWMPYLDDAFVAGKAAGALCCMISGAGPTVLALAGTDEAALSVQKAWTELFAEKGMDADVRVLSVDRDGAVIQKEENA